MDVNHYINTDKMDCDDLRKLSIEDLKLLDDLFFKYWDRVRTTSKYKLMTEQ